MAKKKGSTSGKDSRAEVQRLRSRAEKAEARADRWKARAGRYEKDAAELRTQLKKVTKRLDKATRTGSGPGGTVAQGTTARTAEPLPETPDSGWTVVRLRAEARSRGITGVTTKPKAELLALLTE